MKQKEMISEKISKALFLKNLKEKNINSNIYITFKYVINKKKLKKFQEEKEK